VAYWLATFGHFQFHVPVSIVELHVCYGDRLMPWQMGLPHSLQRAVGILPSLCVIRRLFLNYRSGCGGAGEEERLRVTV
jgi:hypothetical protein